MTAKPAQEDLPVRVGRCSNDPDRCSLARERADLPYAGLDSLCPECGSPLALIASRPQKAPPASPPPPPPVVPAQQPEWGELAAGDGDGDLDDVRPRSGALNATLAVVAAAALLAFGWFAVRMVTATDADGDSAIRAEQSEDAAAPTGVQALFPAEVRRVQIAADARREPDPNALVEVTLQAGQMVDMTGRVNVGGASWARVTLPGNGARSAWVREDQLGMLGDASGPLIEPDPANPNGVAPIPAPLPKEPPPVTSDGPVEPVEPRVMYVTSQLANVREASSAASAKVAQMLYGDTLTVTAQQRVAGRLWFQVELPGGGQGWMNSDLLILTPPRAPMDGPPAQPPSSPPKAEPDAAPPPPGEQGAIGKGSAVTVVPTGANLRAEPSLDNGTIVGNAPGGTRLKVQGSRTVEGRLWYLVETPMGYSGWVSSRVVAPAQ